ncbi:NAD(P)-binding protein [Gonapodya prolifera JEL478]|uniref:NAD(P)-binding protein n=1 Tax=Gonapodya prolifera (strain JEL478) TaxID=1344416 RepID=A0A139AGG6_GONPJ|nr:NAD(P)-binding protein [Gonapodya prolifera JEL478]|eukprot:KXS15654.1 NAD(P)-binding protein [Gonapodya prolifera JEL478]
MDCTVLITGASGLLGRAVLAEFKENYSGGKVVGTGLSRADGKEIIRLDLTKEDEVESVLNEVKPSVIIHCAAERRPDVAERDRDGVLKLNVASSGSLAKRARAINAKLFYISTDYVFDGTSPPYEVDAKPNPLNFYGVSKYEGEKAVLNENPRATIVRVPILYGKTSPGNNAESAVNILLDITRDASKKVNMDHRQARYPTNVADVARGLHALSLLPPSSIAGIFHYSADERFTKYDVCQVLARVDGGRSVAHLVPVTVSDPGAASRPDDARLSTRRIREVLGDGHPALKFVGFEEWWRREIAEQAR